MNIRTEQIDPDENCRRFLRGKTLIMICAEVLTTGTSGSPLGYCSGLVPLFLD